MYERNMEKEKIFVITIALMVGIIGTVATFAIITATAGTVTNTFQAAKVATEIEEEFEGKIKAGSTVKKNPSVKTLEFRMCLSGQESRSHRNRQK